LQDLVISLEPSLKNRVLITNEMPKIAYLLLSRKYSVTWNKSQLTEKQIISKAKSFQAFLTTLADPITKKVFSAAPKLKVVANCAVGFNNIDLKAAEANGVWVTNTPDVLTEATADIVWALLLSCARRVPEGERMVRTGKFKGAHPLMLLGVDLFGKTLGIFGFGRIGKAVARRGRGWNIKILYHQRHREARSVERHYNAKYVNFETLLKSSDFLSVNSPLTSETKGCFTAKEFCKMKRTAVFINTGRGAIHREKDLAMALEKRWIFSAGLDVYEREPRIEKKLLKLKNCTLLPHIGSATVETRNAMARLAVENIDRVLSNKTPKTPVFLLKPLK
jgi:glyoxylate reductase